MEELRKAYRHLDRNPDEKTPLLKPRHGWKDIINVDNKEIEREVVDWIHLAQDRF
jgi:hypothetical protein